MTNLNTEVMPTGLGWYTICSQTLEAEGAKQICGRKVYRRLSMNYPSGIFMEADDHDKLHVHRKVSETVAPLSHLPYNDANIVLDTDANESKKEVKVVPQPTAVTAVVERPVTPPAPVVTNTSAPAKASIPLEPKTGSAIIKGKDAYIPPPSRSNAKRKRKAKPAQVGQG